MSKRNMLLGLAAGKVGDLVFYRDGGEQRTRTRVTPRNPRSPEQMAQRIRMANIPALYRLLAPVVRDSFSNRPSNQSGYNAFASGAIDLSPFMTKAMANADSVLPMPAVISKGVLTSQSFEITQKEGVSRLSLSVSVAASSDATAGRLSDALIGANVGIQAGDRLTFVGLKFFVDDLSTEADIYGGQLSLASLVVDPSSSTYLPDLGLSVEQGILSHTISTAAPESAEIVAGAIILSRVDSTGSLQTSFARLALSESAQSLYDKYRTDNALSDALKSYTGGNVQLLR